jgi:hypothetical protein
MQVAKSVRFSLKDGSEMSLDLSEQLLLEIAKTFQIDPLAVEDKHVKYYLASSLKKTLESNERPG